MKRHQVAAVIPVREFGTSKVRLGSFLSKEKRALLAHCLLNHVIHELVLSPSVSNIVLVSSDLSTAGIFTGSNITTIQERKYHGGVNSAVNDGLGFIASNFKSTQSVLILPSDLPLLTSQAVESAISLLDSHDLVIGPSYKLDGTNVLIFNLPDGLITFHYDNDSYNNHILELSSKKVNYCVLNTKEFWSDLDTKEDYDELATELKAESFETLLQKICGR